MTIEEVKELIKSVHSLKRQCEAVKNKIDAQREEIAGIKSSLDSVVTVKSSDALSVPERVYFKLEELYIEYGNVIDHLTAELRKLNAAIATLDPIEQEIVQGMIDGKTEEYISRKVGYSRRSIQYKKKRILLRLSEVL